MDFERKVIRLGKKSLGVTIPADLVRFLNLKPNDSILLRDERKQEEVFLRIWKKQNGK